MRSSNLLFVACEGMSLTLRIGDAPKPLSLIQNINKQAEGKEGMGRVICPPGSLRVDG